MHDVGRLERLAVAVEQGARIIVETTTAPPGGPTGGFYNDEGLAPW